jgi:hypothetical protein
MQKHMLCFFYLMCLTLITKADEPENGYFKVLPKKRWVSTFTADSRAHRLSMAKNFDQKSWNASMGGIMPVLNFKIGSLPFQWSIAGTTYLTLQRANGAGAVINTDFFGDTWVDAEISSQWFVRVGTGHSSQHLADDAILRGLPFSNYAKDYHFTGLIYKNKPATLQAYGLAYYNYNFKTSTDLSGNWLFQTGFEHAPLKLKSDCFIYYALDLKFREEHRFEPTLNAQIGCKAIDFKGDAIRIALDQTIGKEERGSFMYQTRNFVRLAIYLDF